MTDVWWYRLRDGRINFGDELGPEILKRLGHKPRRVPIGEAELVTCGSIIGHLTNPDTGIWGSGLMHRRPPKVTPRNVYAVRGRLTANTLGVEVPLGDPALLVPLLWERSKPRFRLGHIRHYVDDRPLTGATLVIDPTDPVDEVIDRITSCHAVASSSLHGLIVAEAFGIPAMRLPHPRVGGGDTKWVDYTSARTEPLEDLQNNLLKALPL